MNAETTTSPTGIGFQETMAGGLTLGATDPLLGVNGPVMSMHAAIDISDITAFIADPRHIAKLGGHIDYPPFGSNLAATGGVFGLFTPSGDPALTYMVYELGFQHAGKAYYLAGKKHVQIASIFKLWQETTTLYSLLHEGENQQGPVVGAGVLSLGVWELIKLLTTLRATHSASFGASLCAITRFFVFFAKELVRTFLCKKPLKQ
jgi:hypothetical protein